MNTRIFKGDKWTKLLGSRIPEGTLVQVIKFYPRRRVLIEYQGELINTMLWCLAKLPLTKESERDRESFVRCHQGTIMAD